MKNERKTYPNRKTKKTQKKKQKKIQKKSEPKTHYVDEMDIEFSSNSLGKNISHEFSGIFIGHIFCYLGCMFTLFVRSALSCFEMLKVWIAFELT